MAEADKPPLASDSDESHGAVNRQALARTALFGALDPEDLDRLAGMARSLAFDDGAAVFRKGDPSRSLYVIVAGRLKIASGSADGREMVMNLLGPGDAFGEVALLDGGGRTADAVCIEPLRVLAFDRSDLIPFLEAKPSLMLRMLVALAERVRWISTSYEDSTFLSVRVRMAKRLLRLAEDFGVDTPAGVRITVALPQRELASHIGVTRETISRLLQDWQGDGLIVVNRGMILLPNKARLAAVASGT